MRKDVLILIVIFLASLLTIYFVKTKILRLRFSLEIPIDGKKCKLREIKYVKDNYVRCPYDADYCSVNTEINWCDGSLTKSAGVRLEASPLYKLENNELKKVSEYPTRCCSGTGCRLVDAMDVYWVEGGTEITTSNDCFWKDNCLEPCSSCWNEYTETRIDYWIWDCECEEKWLDEYRCNPYNLDQVDRKYQYSDCSTEWRFWKNCNDNNYCTSWSWTCQDQDTRKGTRTCYDYTCSNGGCVVSKSWTETKLEDCPSGYRCEGGECIPTTPKGEINLIFIGMLSILGVGALAAFLLLPK